MCCSGTAVISELQHLSGSLCSAPPSCQGRSDGLCPKPLVPKQPMYKLTKNTAHFPWDYFPGWAVGTPVLVDKSSENSSGLLWWVLSSQPELRAQPGEERLLQKGRILHKLCCEITPLWQSADSGERTGEAAGSTSTAALPSPLILLHFLSSVYF